MKKSKFEIIADYVGIRVRYYESTMASAEVIAYREKEKGAYSVMICKINVYA